MLFHSVPPRAFLGGGTFELLYHVLGCGTIGGHFSLPGGPADRASFIHNLILIYNKLCILRYDDLVLYYETQTKAAQASGKGRRPMGKE
jgi:hypothetical protein